MELDHPDVQLILEALQNVQPSWMNPIQIAEITYLDLKRVRKILYDLYYKKHLLNMKRDPTPRHDAGVKYFVWQWQLKTQKTFKRVFTPEVPKLDVPEIEGLRCEFCGKQLEYSGKGRHPKYCSRCSEAARKHKEHTRYLGRKWGPETKLDELHLKQLEVQIKRNGKKIKKHRYWLHKIEKSKTPGLYSITDNGFLRLRKQINWPSEEARAKKHPTKEEIEREHAVFEG